MKRTPLRILFACFYCLFFRFAALSAQVVKLPLPVTSLSVNADDTILTVSDSASISTYNTSDYTLVSDIHDEDINRSLFYQEQNGELLIAMTHAGKFVLYRRSSGDKKVYGKTEEYLQKILNRLILPGSLYLAAIAVLPTLIQWAFSFPRNISMLMGGTSLLILVGVDLDTMSQVEALLKMHHHDGLLKKGKIRSRNL